MQIMNLDLIALLNRTLVPKSLCAFFGILLLCLFIQVKATVWPAHEPELVELRPLPAAPRLEASLNLPLFGKYISVSAEGMKKSTLSVELIGIMYSPKASQSQVLIRLNSGEEHSYLVGDELPEGAIIKRIKRDSVIILYQGEMEVLNLPKNVLKFDEPEQPLFKE